MVNDSNVVTLDQAIEIQAAFIVHTLTDNERYQTLGGHLSEGEREAMTKAVMQILRETIAFARQKEQ